MSTSGIEKETKASGAPAAKSLSYEKITTSLMRKEKVDIQSLDLGVINLCIEECKQRIEIYNPFIIEVLSELRLEFRNDATLKEQLYTNPHTLMKVSLGSKYMWAETLTYISARFGFSQEFSECAANFRRLILKMQSSSFLPQRYLELFSKSAAAIKARVIPSFTDPSLVSGRAEIQFKYVEKYVNFFMTRLHPRVSDVKNLREGIARLQTCKELRLLVAVSGKQKVSRAVGGLSPSVFSAFSTSTVPAADPVASSSAPSVSATS